MVTDGAGNYLRNFIQEENVTEEYNFEEYLNKRIVLTTGNNVSWAGVCKRLLTLEEDQPARILVELDAKSGFAVLCPRDFVKKIVVVPIEEIK